MQGAKDLFGSERGVFCLIALVLSALLVVINKLSSEAWLDFMKLLTGMLVASKTVTSAIRTSRAPASDNLPAARVVKPTPSE